MKPLNQIALGFVITFVLATAAQGANVFTATGDLGTAREQQTATLLPNGKVLVAGGYAVVQGSEGGTFTSTFNSAELYDPTNGYWMPTADLASPRVGHTATLLPNGKVLVAGGIDFETYRSNVFNIFSSAELYDPATGTWSPTGSLATKRSAHTATLLPNGKVLVAGGQGTNGVILATAELYDPATGAWSPTGSLATMRESHTATLLPSGKVLVAGGQDNNGGIFASAELYDPATGTWSPTGSLGAGREYHTATLLPNGKVLLVGGTTAELYNPATGAWSPTGSLSAGREYHTATLLPNGKVLVAGGFDINNGILASAELFDPATGTWSPTGSLATARYWHTATLLANGKVLVAGGRNYNLAGSDFLASAELYDPATGIWTPAGSLATGRYYHTATLLASGKVLVVGGNSSLPSDELYDPARSFLNPILNPVRLGDGSIQFGFSNPSGPSYSVLASPDFAAPLTTWSNLGPAAETPPGSGQFQFTDHQAPNYPQRFYRVTSP